HPCRDLAAMRPAVPRRTVAQQYRACLALAPRNQGLRHDFARFLLDHDEPVEALAVLRGAEDDATSRNLTGIALAELGRYPDAVAAFQRAVALDAEPAIAWSNLGLMLKIEGRTDAALAAYDEAIARAPRDPHIRVNRAVALLQAGRWAEAWAEHEWHLRLPRQSALPLDRLLPSLDGIGSLEGVTVLVVHEDGFGNTLQFMRYLPLLAARGARVIAMVPPPLMRLTRMLPGVAGVVGMEDKPPPYDFHCPFFSLPRAFGTTVESVPAAPYLAADPALSAQWRARLPADGVRVGLVWAAQSRAGLRGAGALDARRSAGLAAFAPLAGVPHLRFVSLQAGSPTLRAQVPPVGISLCDPMGKVTDFADTAAVIDNLDVVVSVDTSVVHLAGAMGKPVFLLDRYDNCWRWLSGRTDSPWYPSLTIFRQDTPGDWATPMRRIATAVAALAGPEAAPVPRAIRECALAPAL
ncbi:MAG: tetratricopeptide repeat protein, partial [Rhodospirillales bacterium]|nr:tetratricopeptide repeat protein [Rhodospirillales bacterium]